MRTKSGSLLVLTTLSFAFLGCSQERPESEEKTPPEASAAVSEDAKSGLGHANASVTPGSYEDWCEEHGVPETMCTRCSADLVAAFKATGDWCEEHGLPESQCRQCNPKLAIVRPPKPEGK